MSNPRLDKLYAALDKAGLDAAAINPGPSMFYLSGIHFHLMERPIVALFAPGKAPAVVLPELELPKAALFPYEVRPFAYGESPSTWDEAFRKAARSLGLEGKRIGVEPLAMRLMEFRHVKAGAPEADFPDAGEALGSLRLTKDADEVARLRRAVEIAQGALEAVVPRIKIGMNEREIAAELTVQLLRHGSDPEIPFSPIVSGGPNGANPHASTTERELRPGDLLVIDWGAKYEGYVSDLTRTFAVGRLDAEAEKIHKTVQGANAAGRAAARPGAPCADVDKAAREVIAKAGYGAFFTHRTGHGIGLEGHEDPYMRGDNPQILEPGMAFTVEPGIYLPGRNGARIEDDVVITETGAEALSDMPRGIRVLGQ